MNKEEKQLKENLIYKGRIISLYNDNVLTIENKKVEREYVKHPGGACILPVHNGYIYFEKQFRYPYHKDIIELPAGKLEAGEDPINAAKRELKEEIGFISNDLIYCGFMYPSVGYTNEIIYLYASLDNSISSTNLDDDEFIDVYKVKIEDAYKMLDNNEIHDAKTIILLEKMRKELLK